MKNKDLIIQLIKQDLKHQKLISGLAQVGLEDNSFYELEILTIVQKLMDIKSDELSDTFTDVYYSFMREGCIVEIAEFEEKLPVIATQCYEMLKSLGKIGERVAVG